MYDLKYLTLFNFSKIMTSKYQMHNPNPNPKSKPKPIPKYLNLSQKIDPIFLSTKYLIPQILNSTNTKFPRIAS